MKPTESTPVNPATEDPYVLHMDPEPTEQEREEVVKSFAAMLQRVAAEGRKAGDDGLESMKRIAEQIVGQDNGQALLMRSMLLSIFGKVNVDLSQLGCLDFDLRKDLCAVILGVNQGRFDDYKIREILIAAGDHKASWFFAGVPPESSDNR